jgi:hypothetical protein
MNIGKADDGRALLACPGVHVNILWVPEMRTERGFSVAHHVSINLLMMMSGFLVLQ